MYRQISYDNIARKDQYMLSKQCDGQSNQQNLARLQDAVANVVRLELTKRQREVLELYYFQNMGVQEIAELLGVNKSTVSRTKTRALQRIERFLKYYDFR